MAKKRDKNSKIYRGSYQYERNGNIYLEENFEVFKDKKSLTFDFEINLLSRVSTGELLRVSIDYTINKSYIPQYVRIKRELGEENVEEIYKFNNLKNTLTYQFINGDEHEVQSFQVNPKFYISTPAACTSLLYVKSKKLDANSKNYYIIYASPNKWKYEELPIQRMLALERVSATPESINIMGNNLKGIHYKVYDTDQSEVSGEEQVERSQLHLYASEHMTIPYLIKDKDGTKIQIKYLNNLSKRDVDG